MCVKVSVIIIQSVQIVQKMNAFGARTMKDVLIKTLTHLHFLMANVENGQLTNIVVELHQVRVFFTIKIKDVCVWNYKAYFKLKMYFR